jgi:hypothetical protein
MLDIKAFRQDPQAVETALKRRNPYFSFTPLLALDETRRHLLQGPVDLLFALWGKVHIVNFRGR